MLLNKLNSKNLLINLIPLLTILSLVVYIFMKNIMLIYAAITLTSLVLIYQFIMTKKEFFTKHEKPRKEIEMSLLYTINQNIVNTYYWIESIYKMLQNLEQYLTSEISGIKETINKVVDNISNVIESKVQSIQIKVPEKIEEKSEKKIEEKVEEKAIEKKVEEKLENKVETKVEIKESEKKVESQKVEELQNVNVQDIVNIQEIAKELVNDIIQLRNEIRKFLSKIKSETEQSFDVEHL